MPSSSTANQRNDGELVHLALARATADAVCLGKQTKAARLIHTARAFSVNILTQERQRLSTYFAVAWEDTAPPLFSFTLWHQVAPRLDGSTVALGCVTHAVHERGYRWFIVGKVIAIHRTEAQKVPLVCYSGGYGSLEEVI